MSGSAQPRFSIIVPTINRTESVLKFLDAVPYDGNIPIEVIIVDQNSDDELRRHLEQRADPFPVKHLRSAPPGASRARNLGAEHARYEWLGFTDDDGLYSPEILLITSGLIGEQQPVALSGIFFDPQEPVSSNSKSFFNSAGRRTRHTMLGPVHEGVFFIQRDVFRAVGGFDEHFGPGASFPSTEGVELVSRMLRSMPAVHTYFSPDIILYHPLIVPPWNERAAQRFYTYAYGSGAFLAKHCYAPHTIEYGIRALKMALMVLRTTGIQRTCYRRWLAGFFAGFRAYRAWQRERR